MSAVSKQHEKGSAFRAMHAGDPFVIPNPWDVGSARVLQSRAGIIQQGHV
jgi:2-methylisocitrate lyase-like PEP mutase family enzyme